MPSKSHSPFFGATRKDLQRLRILACAVSAWKFAAENGQYYQLQDAWVILGNKGGTYQAQILDRLHGRALGGLHRAPNWDEIDDAMRMDSLRRRDRGAYETLKLREELAANNDLLKQVLAKEATP